MPIRRKRRVLIPGPVLLGFADVFDAAYGDPKTPRPYARVTPTKIGGVLLPFPCPHCGEVRPEIVDPRARDGYADSARKFSWCPACRKRFVIEGKGMPLKETLLPGATHAPALVERGDGGRETVGEPRDDGLDALGAF